MRLKQILLLALIVSWLRPTDRQTMVVIELSWTAKNDFSQECLKNGDDTGFPSLGEEGLTGWANNQKL